MLHTGPRIRVFGTAPPLARTHTAVAMYLRPVVFRPHMTNNIGPRSFLAMLGTNAQRGGSTQSYNGVSRLRVGQTPSLGLLYVPDPIHVPLSHTNT